MADPCRSGRYQYRYQEPVFEVHILTGPDQQGFLSYSSSSPPPSSLYLSCHGAPDRLTPGAAAGLGSLVQSMAAPAASRTPKFSFVAQAVLLWLCSAAVPRAALDWREYQVQRPPARWHHAAVTGAPPPLLNTSTMTTELSNLGRYTSLYAAETGRGYPSKRLRLVVLPPSRRPGGGANGGHAQAGGA